jgi:hypothetical protein
MTADGQWFDLREQGGQLVRQMGFGKAGTYAIRDLSPGYAIDFFTNTGGGNGTNVALTRDPRVLQLGPDPMSPLP